MGTSGANILIDEVIRGVSSICDKMGELVVKDGLDSGVVYSFAEAGKKLHEFKMWFADGVNQKRLIDLSKISPVESEKMED